MTDPSIDANTDASDRLDQPGFEDASDDGPSPKVSDPSVEGDDVDPTAIMNALRGVIDPELGLAMAVEGVGVGTVLALSDSDDHNDLALLRFIDIVGRAKVFTLPRHDGDQSAATEQAVMGRRPFGSAITRETIEAELAAGSTIRQFTEEPRGFDRWLPLMVVSVEGSARLANDNEKVDAGETAIGFIGRRSRQHHVSGPGSW